MRIDFHPSAAPTLGVEWELALVDRRSRDLRNDAAHLFARAKARLPDPRRTLEVVVLAGDDLGLDLYAGGTPPVRVVVDPAADRRPSLRRSGRASTPAMRPTAR